eukprot:gene5574-9390_t
MTEPTPEVSTTETPTQIDVAPEQIPEEAQTTEPQAVDSTVATQPEEIQPVESQTTETQPNSEPEVEPLETVDNSTDSSSTGSSDFVFIDSPDGSSEYEELNRKTRSLLVSIFCDQNRLMDLNIAPLREMEKSTVKKIIKGKYDLNSKNTEEFQRAVGNVYGVITKFYAENTLSSADLQSLHYEIIVIGDTSAGKDATIANLVQFDIGYSDVNITTKFPERIIKIKSNKSTTYFKFYREGKSKDAKTFDSLAELNAHRTSTHKSYPEVTFETHVIEIHSAEKNMIPITILNLPGFVNVNYREQEGEAGKIFQGLETEVQRLCRKGFGSIYLVRKCKNTLATENWPDFFFKNPNIDKNLLKKLDVVVVHTRSENHVFSVKNNQISIPKQIITFNGLLNSCQYQEISSMFQEFGCNPTHVFIENWDHKDDDFAEARKNSKDFIQFLNKNDASFMNSIDRLKNYFANISISNNLQAFNEFRSHFGIDSLRQEFLRKISKPTLVQIEAICHALIAGGSKLQELLHSTYFEIQKLEKTKLGGRVAKLCSKIAHSIPIIAFDTAYRFEIGQEELSIPETLVFETAIEEFLKLSPDVEDSLRNICENDEEIMKKWNDVLNNDINENGKHFFEFKSSSDRFKKNLFQFAKYVPFTQMSKEHYEASGTNEQYSNKGKSKKDALNQHILRELKRKLKLFAPFISKYLKYLWHSRAQILLKLVVEQFDFKDLSGDVIKHFEETLTYIYDEQFERVLSHDIEEYASKNFFLVDPECLSIAYEIISSAKTEEEKSVLRDFFEKNVENDDTGALKVLKGLVGERSVKYGIKQLFKTDTKKEPEPSIEESFEAAQKYIATSFQVAIKRAIENMWETVILKNFMLFYIYTRDYDYEAEFLLKIVLMKILGVKTVFQYLSTDTKFGLQDVLKNNGTKMNIEPKGVSSFLPPEPLEFEKTKKSGLQGLVPHYKLLEGIEALFNSFFIPLSSDVQNKLLEKLDEKSYGTKRKIDYCKKFTDCFKKLFDVGIAYEKLDGVVNEKMKDYSGWMEKFENVQKIIESATKSKKEASIIESEIINYSKINNEMQQALDSTFDFSQFEKEEEKEEEKEDSSDSDDEGTLNEVEIFSE